MNTKIIIAEDNTSIFSCYQNFLSKDKTIEIIGHALDGETAVEMYKRKKPDIMILDLKLPKKNGLEILNELTLYENEEKKCNVIVISGDTELRHHLYNTRKVYRIIPKPASYDELDNTIKELQKEQMADTFSESKCRELLVRLKLNAFSKNGRLLTQAIKLCYCDLELLDNMKRLFIILSKRNSCSPEKIKSSLRSIIDTANKYAPSSAFNSIFFIEQEDPYQNVSTKYFINGLINELKKGL